MVDKEENCAFVIGEYKDMETGYRKKIEVISNPWRVMVSNPKRWVLNRPNFNELHPDIPRLIEKNTASLTLKKKIIETFPVYENAFGVQCKIYYQSFLKTYFNANGEGEIQYEVELSYKNDQGDITTLSQKNNRTIRIQHASNQWIETFVTFKNYSIQRDSSDQIVVEASMEVKF